MDTNDILIQRIRKLMQEHDILQKQLAVDLKIPITTFNNYLVKKAEFRNSIVVDISKYFDVTTDYLFGLTDIPNVINDESITYHQLLELVNSIEEDSENLHDKIKKIKVSFDLTKEK